MNNSGFRHRARRRWHFHRAVHRVPVFFGFARVLGFYTDRRGTAVQGLCPVRQGVGGDRRAGAAFFGLKLGCKAPLVNWMGKCHVLDLRLDQEYLRSQPVNSEEGAPMGIGIWYEMFISDPVAYLFKNADPRGSLAANVGNSTVRCLSNLKLADMMENRHRHEPDRARRGFAAIAGVGLQPRLGLYPQSAFSRRGDDQADRGEVVNRLRQVTGAIKQDGANQVSIITSTAERQAAIEFAKAAAMRPQIVGAALQKISQDADISRALFEALETQNIIGGQAAITLIPKNAALLGQLVASSQSAKAEAGRTGSGEMNRSSQPATPLSIVVLTPWRRRRFLRESKGMKSGFLNISGTENPHKGEVAVALRVIQSVADYKMIRNFESDVMRADRLDAARWLVQQHANFHAARPQLAQFDHDLRQRFAGVQYIVHQQNIAAADIQAQFLGEDQFSGFGAAPVAGNADEIQAQGQGKAPEQIRQKNNGAVQKRDDDQVAPGEVLFDLAGQGVDAAGQLLLGNQDESDFLAPMARRLLDAFRHFMEFKGKAAGGKFKMCQNHAFPRRLSGE